MKLIDEVLEIIERPSYEFEKYQSLMMEALYSACHRYAYGPNFLAISCNIDSQNMKFIFRLAQITAEPDYNNNDQDATIKYLQKKYGIGTDSYKYT